MMIKNVTQFLREVRLELSKVIWPKFDEWVGSTVVVLVLVFLFAVFLGVVDFGFKKLAELILKSYSV